MNRLNELMKKEGISNEELAFQTGVAKNTISRLRNEDVNCKVFTIKNLTDFFNVSFDYFLGFNTQEIEIEQIIEIITAELRRCYHGRN